MVSCALQFLEKIKHMQYVMRQINNMNKANRHQLCIAISHTVSKRLKSTYHAYQTSSERPKMTVK